MERLFRLYAVLWDLDRAKKLAVIEPLSSRSSIMAVPIAAFSHRSTEPGRRRPMMGSNRSLTVIETLFAFDGRIGRLRFLGFNCLIGVVFLPATFLLSLAIAGNKILQGGGLVVLLLPWLFTMWPGIALLVKRLHDIGWSALHAAWICALWCMPSILPNAFSTLIQLAAATISLCLLLVPGISGPNAYGLKSGMTVDRSAAGGLRSKGIA